MSVMCDNDMTCANEITPFGTLSVELAFKNATEKPFMLLMYSFSEAQIQINNKWMAYTFCQPVLKEHGWTNC